MGKKEQPLDDHGQPQIQTFNNKRNREKAIYGLRGILQGIEADKQLRPREVLFLDAWLRSNPILQKDSDAFDLLDLTGQILEDGIVSADELDDLHGLVECILEHRTFYDGGEEGQINELLGMLAGIVSDNLIHDAEIEHLTVWIDKNQNIANQFPANVVIDRLKKVMADGVVTDEEKLELLDVFKQLSGGYYEETGLAHGLSLAFLEDTVEHFIHSQRRICFTGQFVHGVRADVERIATKLGASVHKRLKNDTNTLIIGSLASRDWRFSSHGRKIEEVLKRRSEGQKITILQEETWFKFVKAG